MKPLAEFTADARRAIKAVLCDIDDTLTTEGSLTAEAYTALELLQGAGFLVLPVTGRPAGWCDHIARMWPVDGIVGENGAFYFRYDHDTRRRISITGKRTWPSITVRMSNGFPKTTPRASSKYSRAPGPPPRSVRSTSMAGSGTTIN
jgi:hypothetical protein